MRLIIPMAGRGTRVRPHSHVTPKPLIPVLGASMVERIVRTFTELYPDRLEEGVFILGEDFPREIGEQLESICAEYGIEARFGRQSEKLGTAHAIYCAGDLLEGEVITVFADTLFSMEEAVDLEGVDGIAWVKKVDDPSRFGVVLREDGKITDFVEKPDEPISDEAVIGIYYIREAEVLKEEIEYLLEHEVIGKGGEYQLTDAMDRMLKRGKRFETAGVNEWLDCGTIPALMNSTRTYLEKERRRAEDVEVENSVIREPVYLGPGVRVQDSVVGPYTSLEEGAEVEQSVVTRSIVFEEGSVRGAVLDDSLVGRHAEVDEEARVVNVGDHSVLGPRG